MYLIFLSIFASLVPKRYRGRLLAESDVNVLRGAILSGSAQVVGFLAFIIFRYISFIHERMAAGEAAVQKTHPSLDKFDMAGPTLANGVMGFLEYIFHPFTIVLFYMACEGIVRLSAATITKEVVPTLPLQAVSWVHSLLNYRRHKSWLGPLVTDSVSNIQEGETTLKIESCRPKPWDMMTTIAFKDRHYELVDYAEQGPPRRFVYKLRVIPPHKLIRGLHHYDPNEEVH